MRGATDWTMCGSIPEKSKFPGSRPRIFTQSSFVMRLFSGSFGSKWRSWWGTPPTTAKKMRSGLRVLRGRAQSSSPGALGSLEAKSGFVHLAVLV